MEHKKIKFKMESYDEETGQFKGWASAFRSTPDKSRTHESPRGDIVVPGAFSKTINDNNGEIMLTYPPHDTNSPVGLGKISDNPKGLPVEGKLTLGVTKADEAHLLMKAGVIRTMSIGYDVVQKEIKDGIRYLKEIKLYEVGLVPGTLAADDEAVVTEVKIADESLDARLRTIQRAYEEATRPTITKPVEVQNDTGWIKEVFEDHVIICKGSTYWQVPYTEVDDVVTFDFANMVEVEQIYQPKAEPPAKVDDQALQQKAGAVTDTPQDAEAAKQLDAILSRFNNEMEVKRASAAIDAMLTKIK